MIIDFLVITWPVILLAGIVGWVKYGNVRKDLAGCESALLEALHLQSRYRGYLEQFMFASTDQQVRELSRQAIQPEGFGLSKEELEG